MRRGADARQEIAVPVRIERGTKARPSRRVAFLGLIDSGIELVDALAAVGHDSDEKPAWVGGVLLPGLALEGGRLTLPGVAQTDRA